MFKIERPSSVTIAAVKSAHPSKLPDRINNTTGEVPSSMNSDFSSATGELGNSNVNDIKPSIVDDIDINSYYYGHEAPPKAEFDRYLTGSLEESRSDTINPANPSTLVEPISLNDINQAIAFLEELEIGDKKHIDPRHESIILGFIILQYNKNLPDPIKLNTVSVFRRNKTSSLGKVLFLYSDRIPKNQGSLMRRRPTCYKKPLVFGFKKFKKNINNFKESIKCIQCRQLLINTINNINNQSRSFSSI